jgi:hypothetical protein
LNYNKPIKPEANPPPDPPPIPEFWAGVASAARQATVDLGTVESLIAGDKVEVARIQGERCVRVDQVLSALAAAAGGSTS